MLTVAVTGGIAAGKSTVVDLFRKKGVAIVDTDVVARQVVEDNTVKEQLSKVFGNLILNQDGSLNRAKLREIAFENEANRLRLGEILHPRIFERATKELNHVQAPYALLVIPLLYESKLPYRYDRVLVVDVDEKTQRLRASQRDQAREEHIQKIIDAQASREQRLSIADDIIDNSGSISDLIPQVDALHDKYLALAY